MSKKEKTAGSCNSATAKKKSSKSIISEPIDVVNMSESEIIAAAIDRLQKEDLHMEYDRYAKVMHAEVTSTLCCFCEQNAEFARAICQTDKTLDGCLKAVSKGVHTGISDLEAYTRAVQYYFAGATVSFKMLIDVGDGVLNETAAETQQKEKSAAKPQRLEIGLESLLDW
nr:hypothetical protein [uncultured Ruminococcus sp.]